ncbi:MAG: hypothetical protein JWN78_2147 [Bacteroidota bacterium]|nr:hypothetical protein [Bacteroidota bacterium]
MNTDNTMNSGILAGLGVFLFIFFGFIIFFYICRWKIFTKAGQEGWKSIIPIYNIVVQLEIAKQPTIWILFFLIPFVNIYFAIRHVNGISRAFGKDTGFTIGLIFLPIIFYPMLAFGDAQYQYTKDDGLINELQEVR